MPGRSWRIWKTRSGTCMTGRALIENSSFGENAETAGRHRPGLPGACSFLVAALISLTSMTRMVEEQRTAIGTMKALGYGQLAIAFQIPGVRFPRHSGRQCPRRPVWRKGLSVYHHLRLRHPVSAPAADSRAVRLGLRIHGVGNRHFLHHVCHLLLLLAGAGRAAVGAHAAAGAEKRPPGTSGARFRSSCGTI